MQDTSNKVQTLFQLLFGYVRIALKTDMSIEQRELIQSIKKTGYGLLDLFQHSLDQSYLNERENSDSDVEILELEKYCNQKGYGYQSEQQESYSALSKNQLSIPKRVINPGVLIIGDCDDSATHPGIILRRMNLKPFLVSNGVDALNILLNISNIGLIFTDLQLTLLDGWTTAERIIKLRKEQNLPRIPIVAVSEFNGEVAEKFIEKNSVFDDFLKKPIKFDDFMSVVKKYLKAEG